MDNLSATHARHTQPAAVEALLWAVWLVARAVRTVARRTKLTALFRAVQRHMTALCGHVMGQLRRVGEAGSRRLELAALRLDLAADHYLEPHAMTTWLRRRSPGLTVAGLMAANLVLLYYR
jgi:hypothetical protein